MMRGQSLCFAVITVALSTSLCASVALGFFYLRARWDPFPRSLLRFEGDWPFQRDEEIGFVAVRNGRTLRRDPATGLSHHLFTDDRGARVTRPGDRTPARIDLLTIGCSFAYGLANDETFTEGLRQRLGIPVANFALGSYGTVHSLLMLRRQLDLRPRVVVYAMIEDHLRRNLSPCAASYAPFCTPVAHVAFSEEGTPTIHPPRWDYFSPALNRQFYEEITMTDHFSVRDVLWRARVDLFQIRESRAIAFPDDEGRRAASLRWLIGQLEETARGAGATLLVVYIPSLRRGEAAPPPAAVVAATTARGIALVNLTPRVLDYHADARRPSLMLGEDAHPSAAGHALIADELARVIRARHLLE